MNNSHSIPTNRGLDHVGIVVPNAQYAADFLMQVFGAEWDWEVKREPTPTAKERGWDQIFGVHPDAYLAHVIMLKCGTTPMTQYVELFEWHTPQKNHAEPWQFSAIGNNYISFTVQDIQAVVAHIKRQVLPLWPGTRLIQDPPMQFPLRGETCTSTFLVSPWGMWIELTEWSDWNSDNALIGQSIFDLPTPALLIDLDRIDHNIQLMRERINGSQQTWRIPCKAHKCPELTRYLLKQSKADGVVLLTLQEVQAFAKAGIKDIYLANQVTFSELQQLVKIADTVDRLRIAIDDADYLSALVTAAQQCSVSKPIEVLIEFNINHHRCGVDDIAIAIQLAKTAQILEEQTGVIVLAGITGYEGHTPLLPPAEKRLATEAAHAILAEAKIALEKAGITVNVVSGGGSCNYIDCTNINVLTEIQAGGGILCDALYSDKAGLKHYGHQYGVFLLTEMISVPTNQNRAVGNAGFKTLGWHPYGGFPEFRDREDLTVSGLSAEHVRIMSKTPGQPVNLTQGDKIMLIPGYTDAMGFLHRKIIAFRQDKVEAVWATV